MNSFGPALFSLVFIAIGTGILFCDRKVAAKARRSPSWPSSEGVISRSAVLLSAAGHAQDIIARYPDGAPATVYYDPTDPSDSVLEPGGTSGIAILEFIGWAFAAGGLFFLYKSLTGRIHTGR